jgi:hypothetical protein
MRAVATESTDKVATLGPRLLSYSEVDTAQTCWAQWDFKYGGRLAGDTLKPKELAPKLSDGRAWGAAVAAWHQHSDELLASHYAHTALIASFTADYQAMLAAGVPVDRAALLAQQDRLHEMLDHYMASCEPLPNLTRLEEQVIVPIPSRGGQRASTRYRFLFYPDGFTIIDGQRWLVEFKLRDQLQKLELMQKAPQYRWYSWGIEKRDGKPIMGILIDERLNEVPKPARINKGDKVSHAKDQITTPELYVEACHAHGEVPKPEIVDHLRQRRWQHREPIPFRPSELKEAGEELVSAAKLIRDLDSGELAPMRHAKTTTCNFCRFKTICPNPQDRTMVDLEFDRTVPKRLRGPMLPTERSAA